MYALNIAFDSKGVNTTLVTLSPVSEPSAKICSSGLIVFMGLSTELLKKSSYSSVPSNEQAVPLIPTASIFLSVVSLLISSLIFAFNGLMQNSKKHGESVRFKSPEGSLKS